jgi:hypothetical protein
MYTQKKNSSGPAQETAPTVALSANGHLEESKPDQPGAITLSSKQEFNNKGNFDQDMRSHYEPEGISNKIKCSVCMAGEMAAHAGSLTVSAQKIADNQYSLTLCFPPPENKTIPVGEKGVMVEHPLLFYGGNTEGVSVLYNHQTKEVALRNQVDSVLIKLDTFPQLKDKIEESLEK